MRLLRSASFLGWGRRSIAVVAVLTGMVACDSDRLSPVGGYCRRDLDCEPGLRCVARDCQARPPPLRDLGPSDMGDMGLLDMPMEMGPMEMGPMDMALPDMPMEMGPMDMTPTDMPEMGTMDV
jgi:hypothetical protein